MVYHTKRYWRNSWPLFIAILITIIIGILTKEKIVFGYCFIEILVLTLGYLRYQKKTIALNNALNNWKIPSVKSKMVTYDAQAQEQVFEIDSQDVREGDLLVLEANDIAPCDAKILTGTAEVQEAILTSSKTAVEKNAGDFLIGGTQILKGKLKVYATATGDKTVVENIKKRVLTEKPMTLAKFLKLARLQNFLSVALFLASIAFLYYTIWPISKNISPIRLSQGLSLMISAALLQFLFSFEDNIKLASLIGLQRKVIFSNETTWAQLHNANLLIMKKNGVLIEDKSLPQSIETRLELEEFKSIVYSLCRYNNSSLSQTIKQNWQSKSSFSWSSTQDLKEDGIKGIDEYGNSWQLSYDKNALMSEKRIFLYKNESLIGSFQIAEKLRVNTDKTLEQLHQLGIVNGLLSLENGRYIEKLNAIAQFDELWNLSRTSELLPTLTTISEESSAIYVHDDSIDKTPENIIKINLLNYPDLGAQDDDILILEKNLLSIPYAIALGRSIYRQIINGFWRSMIFIFVVVALIFIFPYTYLPGLLLFYLLICVPNFGERKFAKYKIN